MSKKQKRIVKTTTFQIVGSACDMSWLKVKSMLGTVRYRVRRLANLTLTDMYVSAERSRKSSEPDSKIPRPKMSELNRKLREMLEREGKESARFAKKGALPDSVASAIWQNKIQGHVKGKIWSDILKGNQSLPTFRLNTPIPIRCHKKELRRLEQTEAGQIELDLMVSLWPYPRVTIGTRKLDPSRRKLLQDLLSNTDNSTDGYRHRCFEVKEDRRGQWWLSVVYDFPASTRTLNPDIVVGVDVGYSLPLYAAINNGLARLGRTPFIGLGRHIKDLQKQVDARRRSIQHTGRKGISSTTARSGHGTQRKLLPTEILQDRVNKAYQTMNHQLSAAVIKFAKDHGAGTIQVENTETLKEVLVGTFLGKRWRYYQLQQFLEYKAEEAGIKLRKINPKYTSRRCSICGYINVGFDRAYRSSHQTKGKATRFECPKCQSDPVDADYNAARNISTLDIENKIRLQCKEQGIEY